LGALASRLLLSAALRRFLGKVIFACTLAPEGEPTLERTIFDILKDESEPTRTWIAHHKAEMDQIETLRRFLGLRLVKTKGPIDKEDEQFSHKLGAALDRCRRERRLETIQEQTRIPLSLLAKWPGRVTGVLSEIDRLCRLLGWQLVGLGRRPKHQ
jgi:hypothetical protein